MQGIEEILTDAVNKGVSDVFIVAGIPISYKINGQIVRTDEAMLMPQDTEKLVREMYERSQRELTHITNSGDDDFSFAIPKVSRFRVNAYKQRGSLAAVVRIIRFDLPNYQDMHIPEDVMRVADISSGFVVVTGPAASGKSTTLACIVDAVNSTKNGHIITLEDPIEYLHRHKKSVVSQREIPLDTKSYVTAITAALRQAPNMILLGEMRDSDTIRTAVTAAETGHFIISTLHTIGAANTIDRIIDAFPEHQQEQIRYQLSMVLKAVISQQLVPTVDGGVIPAFEIMYANTAIRNLIREKKTHQIDSAIFAAGADEHMIAMDTSLFNLYKAGIISQDNAILYSLNKPLMQKKIASGR